MAHKALYRTKRPPSFTDVVGQQHIVRILANQIKADKISHAYLFCGTRGTGKTSIARIFSRAINCENLQDGNPCNTCESCLGILAERNLNVVEIDAASNNGVENIRDLREEVKYQPTSGRYKVFIIDEVHMLSTSAFNALLKTLEEPPKHVVFLLATTDTHKLPATILSRCQRYDFRRIGMEDIKTSLKTHLETENITYEDQAIDYIAYHADGAMRDALSLLDQSLGMITGGESLSYRHVLDMLGAVDRSHLVDLATALYHQDTANVMAIIDNAMASGRDTTQFVNDLIRYFRDLIIENLTEGGAGATIPTPNLMEYIHSFSETIRDMRFAPHPRTTFEVAALKLCMPRITQAEIPLAAPTQTAPPPAAKPVPKPDLKSVTPTVLDNIVNGWDNLCQSFPNPMRSQCAQCGLQNNNDTLEIITSTETMRNIIKPKEAAIREAMADKFSLSTPPAITTIVQEDFVKPKAKVAPPPPPPPPYQEPVQQAIPADWDVKPAPPPDDTFTEDDWNAIGEEI